MSKKKKREKTYQTTSILAIDRLAIVSLAKHFIVLESELFARRQLSLTALAGKTGQMVHVVFGSAHPIAWLYVSRAFGAFDAEISFFFVVVGIWKKNISIYIVFIQ